MKTWPTACLVLLVSSAASAQVPGFITYSGRLTDGTGWGQSTVLDLVVTVYDAAEGGNVVFRGRHPGVPVVDGYFTVNLGMCSESGACIEDPADAGFPSTLPGQAWLSVAVDGGLELGPLQPIGSVPYAVTAGSVAGGAVVSGNLTVEGDLTVTGRLKVGGRLVG